jgi:hypothetical protein
VHITQWLRFFICSPNRFMVIHNLLTVNCCENSCYDFSRQTHRAIGFEALWQCYKHTNNNASNQKILLVNNTHWPLYCTVHVYIVSTSFCDRGRCKSRCWLRISTKLFLMWSPTSINIQRKINVYSTNKNIYSESITSQKNHTLSQNEVLTI